MSTAFLTGSWAYGTTHEKSDVDLVIHISEADLERFKSVLSRYDGVIIKGKGSIKVGPLNLVCHTDESMVEAWRTATKELEQRRPVTKPEAIRCIDGAIEYAGLTDVDRFNGHLAGS